MIFDATDPASFRTSMLNAIVAPRPIGWISTVNTDGVPNLAPFSYFNAVSSTPPMVAFAANAPTDRAEKDTLANVRAVPEFVANLACHALREAVNLSSAPAPHGVSEFGVAGVTPAACRSVAPPRVAEAPANLECRVVRIVDFPPQGAGERHSALVVGRVVAVHVADALIDADGRFDTAAARPIARLGGFDYAALGELFEMPRPPWPPAGGE